MMYIYVQSIATDKHRIRLRHVGVVADSEKDAYHLGRREFHGAAYDSAPDELIHEYVIPIDVTVELHDVNPATRQVDATVAVLVVDATGVTADATPPRPVFPFPPGDVFIETGTGNGFTLGHALTQPYKAIHSIDVNPLLTTAAREKYGDDPRLRVHLGSSADVLPALLNSTARTVFWLDAHYSFGRHSENVGLDKSLARTYGECPLLAELRAIMAVDWLYPPMILIDDVGCFTRSLAWAKDLDEAQWPTEDQIRAALPGYTLSVVGGRYYVCERVT